MNGTGIETVAGLAAIWIWALGVLVTARLTEPKPYGAARRLLTLLLWPLALALHLVDAAWGALCRWLVEKVLP